MTDLVVRAQQVLVDGVVRSASVAVRDGMITAVGPVDADHGPAVEHTVDRDGVLLPGFVDSHVHIDDPGTDWEGFPSATAAAAAAGITTLVDMPLDSIPVTTTVAALQAKHAAAQGRCRVDVGFWGGVVPGNLGRLADLAAAGVTGFKCFLTASGNPDFPPLTAPQLRTAVAEVAALDSVLLVHAEDDVVIAASPRADGPRYRDFLASRPDTAERVAVALLLDAAAVTGARVHVVHVSSADVLALLAGAKAQGTRVSAETCPHYLTFAAEDVPDGGTEFAVCPPIRGRANRDELWAALRDGTLDMVVSDHSPCAPEVKGHGDFGQVFAGVSSLQLGPSVMWTHARERGYGLAELHRWMSQRPAELAGYADRGVLAPGMRADLCVFDPTATHTVQAERLAHRHPSTPYDGMVLRGAVRRTWVAGRCVYEQTGAAA